MIFRPVVSVCALLAYGGHGFGLFLAVLEGLGEGGQGGEGYASVFEYYVAWITC